MKTSGDIQSELCVACFWLRYTVTMVSTLPLARERKILVPPAAAVLYLDTPLLS